MSSVSKGNSFELEVKKYLEATGWIVFRQHRKPMFINGRMITVGADIFGSDMVARKKGERLLWVQVSTEGQKSAKQKQLLVYPWNLTQEDVEIWLRIRGKKAFRRFCLQRDNTFVEAPIVEVGNDKSANA